MHFSAAVAASNTSSNGPDGASASQGASLSISGQVTVENPFVKMGAFHTLDLEVNRDVRIVKAEWDSIALSRARESCEEGRGAEVGAIICGEGEYYEDTQVRELTTAFRYCSSLFTFRTYDCYSPACGSTCAP